MATIHQFTGRFVTSAQLSAYVQGDGSNLYCVEVLFSDDTWEIVSSTKDRGQGFELARVEAEARNAVLLGTSSFPGRAA